LVVENQHSGLPKACSAHCITAVKHNIKATKADLPAPLCATLVARRELAAIELQMGCLVWLAAGPEVSAPLPLLAGFTPTQRDWPSYK